MQEIEEMKLGSLDREDPLEEEMATHSNILASRIPWTQEPAGLQPWGRKESDMIEHTCTTNPTNSPQAASRQCLPGEQLPPSV